MWNRNSGQLTVNSIDQCQKCHIPNGLYYTQSWSFIWHQKTHFYAITLRDCSSNLFENNFQQKSMIVKWQKFRSDALSEGMDWHNGKDRYGGWQKASYLFTGARHLAEFTVFPLRRVNWHPSLLVPPHCTTTTSRCITTTGATPASPLASLRLAVVGSNGIQRLVKTCYSQC